MTSLVTLGLATAIPATALVTETAGVNIPSAIVKLVPKRHWKIYQLSRQLQARGGLTQMNKGHLNASLRPRPTKDLPAVALLVKLSPVRVRSESKSSSSGGNRPWKRANVPPSPVVHAKVSARSSGHEINANPHLSRISMK